MTSTPELPPPEVVLTDLVTALGVRERAGHLEAHAPDWWGERVFGGAVVAWAAAAASATAPGAMRPHSLHAAFLGPVRSGPVAIQVDGLRDGRTFSTRQVSLIQNDRETTRAWVSFHADEDGLDYELGLPDVPAPDAVGTTYADGPFEARDLGPTARRADGSRESTRRTWVRTVSPLPDDPAVHLALACYCSDWTESAFRPTTEPDWGSYTDASIDHAVWFHRPFRLDDWLFIDLQTVVNAGGRAAIRGQFHSGGRLVMSMAQELLIRPTR